MAILKGRLSVSDHRRNCNLPGNSQEKEAGNHFNSRSINQFGLLTIGIAVIAISLIFLLFYRSEKRVGEKRLVKDGFTLCSLIADLVRQEFLIDDKLRNLNLLDYVVREKGLMYCLVVDNNGIPLIQLGRQMPEENPASGKNTGKSGPAATIEYLMTQQRLVNREGEVRYEFSKPIYLEGDRRGLVKIGLALSDYIHFNQEVGYLAPGIALTIFGLVFLFYYLLKRLFLPLYQINYHLKQIIRDEPEFPKIELSFQGEVGQLTEAMNQLLHDRQKKNQQWEASNAELEISNKILLYEKSRMRAILDNLKIGLIVIDSTGRAILANNLAGHFLRSDYAPGEHQSYLGQPWKQLLHDQNQDLEQMFHTFYGKENIYAHDSLEVQTIEGGLVQGTGDRLPTRPEAQGKPGASVPGSPGRSPVNLVLCHCCSYLLDEEDKPLGFLWTITDITAQKQSESARHEFVNHVAHELKTPLNTLLSYTELLLDGEVDDEQTKREFFNSINEEAARLSRLINNLLNISKIEMGSLKINPTLIKVDKLIKDCFQTVRAQAVGKGINFSMDVADKMPNLLLDKDLIEIAILNLLTNAIKYTPAPGKIVLQGIVEDEKFVQGPKERLDEAHILIRVTDSGYGIPENEINRIFDKFFRSEREEIRKEAGTGLGLSLAMNIVQLHKGDIKVESNWGSGSSFTIILPREEVYI